ncbi:Gfo/Idh/MocA family oxidoreductase [uncultured Gimesia sp.]|uniref:Gfo/Idh/MocA family oxidoreductase n=1 Tax=uncultured Gimesia sp. TaxID=1678688 RepID=UPI0026026796|nr:Gfo/Idh/MocA family oxidoreductase [uncultured Gimesia sp.]
MQKNSNFSRRDFLKSTTAGAAAISTGVWTGFAPAASKSANGKLNIACIGTANRAAADIDGVKGENIVALVDIDSNYLDRASANFPGARRYADYREMLESEDGKIDAVVIGTTDHHHAPASIRAIRKGLHVYCEKPLTHTVQEARIIAQEAKKHGVATQLGTQVHASDNYRRVVEIVQSGILGDVNEVHVWVGKGWGGGELPSDTQEPPKNLSWDLWLGPAPVRPFAAGRYHPAQWRRWWQFGQGTLGDMACHYMDLPFWALDLKHPTHCEAEGPEVHPETCPHGLTVRYQFPKRGKLVPVKLTWYDGNMIPKKVAGERVPGSGVMFVGTEGTMFANYGGYKLFPKEKFADFKPPKQTIPKSIGHHAEWIKACKDGSPTTCNFDYSGALTEAVLLGNVSYRAKSPLEWDAANLKATNCPAADKYISKEYRKGWEVS